MSRCSDARGRRISKAVTNSGAWDCTYHYYYDGDSVVETRSGSDIMMRQHVWGARYIDELVQIGLNQPPDAKYNVLGVVMSNGRLGERYFALPVSRSVLLSASGLADVKDSRPSRPLLCWLSSP
jgi:hypothetical protein